MQPLAAASCTGCAPSTVHAHLAHHPQLGRPAGRSGCRMRKTHRTGAHTCALTGTARRRAPASGQLVEAAPAQVAFRQSTATCTGAPCRGHCTRAWNVSSTEPLARCSCPAVAPAWAAHVTSEPLPRGAPQPSKQQSAPLCCLRAVCPPTCRPALKCPGAHATADPAQCVCVPSSAERGPSCLWQGMQGPVGREGKLHPQPQEHAASGGPEQHLSAGRRCRPAAARRRRRPGVRTRVPSPT